MGMGTAPAQATCISLENLTELCPAQMATLGAKLEEFGQTWEGLAELLYESSPRCDDYKELDLTKEQAAELSDRWRAVCNEFANVTFTNDGGVFTAKRNQQVGHFGRCLYVHIGYYDPASGDLYDDLESSYFFSVEGAYQMTPAGERFKDKLEDKMWATYG